MSVYRDPNAPRFFTYGTRNDKAAAVLPATTTATIFTVAGGRLMLTALVGQVTTIMSATATNLKVTSTPTVGSAVDLCINGAVTSKEVGALVALPAAVASALVVANAGAVTSPPGLSLIIPAGTIQITTDATNTGAMKWSMLWIPLDDGVTVS